MASLVRLRESVGQMGSDLFTTAQTMVNVALSHVRATTSVPTQMEVHHLNRFEQYIILSSLFMRIG